MRAIEHSVEEEPLIKKAKKMITDNVEEEVPKMLLQNETVPLLDIEEKKETACVVLVVEEPESNESKIEEVSAMSVVEKKETLEMEKIDEASVNSVVESSDEVVVVREKKDSGVDASGGIKEEIRLNPLFFKRKLLVLDLNGLLADIVSPLADVKADINIGRRASEFLNICLFIVQF